MFYHAKTVCFLDFECFVTRWSRWSWPLSSYFLLMVGPELKVTLAWIQLRVTTIPKEFIPWLCDVKYTLLTPSLPSLNGQNVFISCKEHTFYILPSFSTWSDCISQDGFLLWPSTLLIHDVYRFIKGGKTVQEGGCENYSKYLEQIRLIYLVRIQWRNRDHLAVIISWHPVPTTTARWPLLVHCILRK